MDNSRPWAQMERKILMSRESENIVRQWEEQKQIQKQGDPMLKIMQQLMKPAPRPKAKAPKKKKK